VGSLWMFCYYFSRVSAFWVKKKMPCASLWQKRGFVLVELYLTTSRDVEWRSPRSR
jgi:hypothetical protein